MFDRSIRRNCYSSKISPRRPAREQGRKEARLVNGWTVEVFPNDWPGVGAAVGLSRLMVEGAVRNGGRYADVLMTRTESGQQTAG